MSSEQFQVVITFPQHLLYTELQIPEKGGVWVVQCDSSEVVSGQYHNCFPLTRISAISYEPFTVKVILNIHWNTPLSTSSEFPILPEESLRSAAEAEKITNANCFENTTRHRMRERTGGGGGRQESEKED